MCVIRNWTWGFDEQVLKEFHMLPTGNIGNQTGTQDDGGAP